jgi:hypothetical protein
MSNGLFPGEALGQVHIDDADATPRGQVDGDSLSVAPDKLCKQTALHAGQMVLELPWQHTFSGIQSLLQWDGTLCNGIGPLDAIRQEAPQIQEVRPCPGERIHWHCPTAHIRKQSPRWWPSWESASLQI